LRYHEFLEHFALVAHGFEIKKNKKIRAGNACPITLLCEKLKGIHYQPAQAVHAAAHLDIDLALFHEIVTAADGMSGLIMDSL